MDMGRHRPKKYKSSTNNKLNTFNYLQITRSGKKKKAADMQNPREVYNIVHIDHCMQGEKGAM